MSNILDSFLKAFCDIRDLFVKSNDAELDILLKHPSDMFKFQKAMHEVLITQESRQITLNGSSVLISSIK